MGTGSIGEAVTGLDHKAQFANGSAGNANGSGGVVLSVPPTMLRIQLDDVPVTSQDASSTCHEFWCNKATIFRLFNLVVMITLIVGTVVVFQNPDNFLFGWSGIGGIVICLFVYLFDTFYVNASWKFLKNVGLINGIHMHIAEVRQAKPVITWKMTCYHYDNTSTSATLNSIPQGRHGQANHSSFKAETWSGTHKFDYAECWDASPPNLSGLGKYKHTRVKFDKTYGFDDVGTEAEYTKQKNAFVEMNRKRDAKYDFTEEFTLPGYVPAAVASASAERPFFLMKRYYVIAVLLLMELPFSFCMRTLCPVTKFTYKKILRC